MPLKKCTVAASRPAAAGIGMPTKYFRPGRPGLRGCASWLILNRASRDTPPIRNRKQMNAPACTRCWRSCVIDRFRQKMESPDHRQQARRHAKRDHVGQRIQLLAKFAGGVGHARDAPVQRVERNRKHDRNRRPVQMRVRIAVGPMASIVCVIEE